MSGRKRPIVGSLALTALLTAGGAHTAGATTAPAPAPVFDRTGVIGVRLPQPWIQELGEPLLADDGGQSARWTYVSSESTSNGFFGAVAPEYVDDWVAAFDYGATCGAADEVEFDNGSVVGTRLEWTDCGDAEVRTQIIGLSANGETGLFAQLETEEAERPVLEELLADGAVVLRHVVPVPAEPIEPIGTVDGDWLDVDPQAVATDLGRLRFVVPAVYEQQYSYDSITDDASYSNAALVWTGAGAHPDRSRVWTVPFSPPEELIANAEIWAAGCNEVGVWSVTTERDLSGFVRVWTDCKYYPDGYVGIAALAPDDESVAAIILTETPTDDLAPFGTIVTTLELPSPEA